MVFLTDVSPTSANTNASADEHCVTGRMLSVACTPNGQHVFLGSYSNVWKSTDAGRTFDQLTCDQPAQDQYDAPGSLGGCVHSSTSPPRPAGRPTIRGRWRG